MINKLRGTIAISALILNAARGQNADLTSHTVQFVPVEETVKLEVVDWGGSGRAMLLLAGLGDTAHVFDTLAPKLTGTYHVYGITRRGFGSSTAPLQSASADFSADRLGDDVLAVVDALKLRRPILVGHSIAGEELSSIGSRHPEKIAGLVYLDAGYGYAFYDSSRGDLYLDLFQLEKKLRLMEPGKGPNDTRPIIQDLLAELPRFEENLKRESEFLQSLPPKMLAGSSASMKTASQLVIAGEQRYTDVRAPILAIFAIPHDMDFDNDTSARQAFEAQDEASTGRQIKAFEAGLPQARVVRLAHANHYVFRSNEGDVIREINEFVNKLPRAAQE